MYKQTIPRYVCVNGVWQPNFGNGKTFTQKDVKDIYMARNILCVFVELKDGTKICPDCTIASNEDILEMRFNNWVMDILHLKKTLPKSRRQYVEYSVFFTDGEYVGETTAVSPKDAVNKVRYREFGYDMSNDRFIAVRSDGRGNNLDADGLFWYAIEFSIGDCDDCDFDLNKAHYEMVRGESKLQAKNTIQYFYFKFEDDKCSFVNICFGRIDEFTTESEAILCLSKWKTKNKEEIVNEEAERL